MKDFTFDMSNSDDRGLYPEEIKCRAPRGLRKRVKEAAAQQGVSMGEFYRRALEAAVNRHEALSELARTDAEHL